MQKLPDFNRSPNINRPLSKSLSTHLPPHPASPKPPNPKTQLSPNPNPNPNP